MHMSVVLSSVVAGTSASSSSQSARPSSSDSQNTCKQSMTLFSGAVIQGGNFSIHINIVNQSLTHHKSVKSRSGEMETSETFRTEK